MDTHKKDLQRQDKATLIAIIQRMLQLQPDLSWVLKAVQPVLTQEKNERRNQKEELHGR